MEIKQAILQSEKNAVKEFLTSFDLRYLLDTTYTAYIEEKDEIVGTVSLRDNVITLLAVSPEKRGENLALTLVNHALSKLRENNIYGYKVFTKPEYLPLFENMGFRLLVKTEKFCALEGGQSFVEKAVDDLRTKVVMDLGGIDEDTAAIVINGNPFTLGHLALCEYALKRHRKLLVFVLQEDLSQFSFKERYSLAFLATRAYVDRICVLPSTEYIVSKATFPDYFLRGADERTEAYAEYDALLFQKYFMEKLGIVKRYFGSEKTDYMRIYNATQQKVLGDRAEIIDRATLDGVEISAKAFRQLVKEGKREEALALLPQSTLAVMNLILRNKQW